MIRILSRKIRLLATENVFVELETHRKLEAMSIDSFGSTWAS
jgi:hypothetical protein